MIGAILISLVVGVTIGYCLCAILSFERHGRMLNREPEPEVGWCEYIQKIKEAEEEES